MKFLSLLLIFIIPFSLYASANCGTGKKIIVFHTDSLVENFTPDGFCERLFSQLKTPLNEIGYCLVQKDVPTISDSTEHLYMFISMKFDTLPENDTTQTSTGKIGEMIISLLETNNINKRTINESLNHPLISLSYNPNELSTFESVLIRKTVENLRTQYVCHLRIQSNPQGVHIKTETGLQGDTPLEWIIPVGQLSISGELDGYEGINRKLDLDEPGIHTYFLQMRKKLFYHSKFMYPTVTFALLSGVFYIAEHHYYNEYLQLSENDYFNHPERFSRSFNKAKNYERAAVAALSLSGVSLFLTFWF